MVCAYDIGTLRILCTVNIIRKIIYENTNFLIYTYSFGCDGCVENLHTKHKWLAFCFEFNRGIYLIKHGCLAEHPKYVCI